MRHGKGYMRREKEIERMQAIQREAMVAGAFGWSAMKTLANRPDDGRFIPSQVASNDEFLALAQVLGLSLESATSDGHEAPPSGPFHQASRI